MFHTIKMELSKKSLYYITALYIFLIVIANLLGSQIPYITNNINNEIITLTNEHSSDSLSFIRECIFYFSFILPSLITIIRVINVKKDNMKTFFINMPLTYSITGMLGWAWAFFTESIFTIYFSYVYKISVTAYLAQSFSMTTMECLVTFILSYLMIEIIHRSFFLPHYFSNGHLVDNKGKKDKSYLKLMFIIFYIAICLFPLLYTLNNVTSILQANNISTNKTTINMTILFLIFGLILTFLFQYIITKPVKLLKEGAENIKNGDYNKKINFIASDDFGLLADSFNDMTKSLKEKEFMRDTFGKVVDPYVRDYLMKGNVALGGETIEVSVMFCDIRSFTRMSENMEPKDVVSLLNIYFTKLGECISKNHGIINKYIGDAVMAIFGAPVHSDNHALDAYNAALDMRKALIELNKTFKEKDLPEIHFGIGIHSGKVLAGNIGATSRMEYTVIGDTVNTASRIESLCKEYKTDLLLTESTKNMLGESGNTLTLVADASIRGKEEKVKLYN